MFEPFSLRKAIDLKENFCSSYFNAIIKGKFVPGLN
jgi:hypothetical protein